MTLRRNILTIIMTCFLPFTALLSQNDTAGVDLRELYQNQRQQIMLLQHLDPALTDSLVLREADAFAAGGDYEMALALLEDIALPSLPEQTPVSATDFSIQPPVGWNLQMEAGSDYSRQEYEMALLENDSVVVDELANPYISVRASRTFNRNNAQLQWFGFGRADRELLEGSLSGALLSSSGLNPWRIEAQTSLYHYRKDDTPTFFDNRLFGQIYRSAGGKNRLLLEGTLRGKIFSGGQAEYANLWDGDILAQWQRRVNLKSVWRFSLEPGFYAEKGSEGFQYVQTGAEIAYEYRSAYNHFTFPSMAAGWRRFSSSTDSTDYNNSFIFLQPEIDLEIPISDKIGIAAKGRTEWRQYTTEDPNYTDYLRNEFSTMLKYYFGDYNALGIGFYFENENHYSSDANLSAAADMYDYRAPGFILSADILRDNGFMLSLNYTYGTKTFPQGQQSDLTGFYSNRRIHSIQGFGLLPLTSGWQFQFFVNYDDDRDREQEFNDNFSTVFNAGFIYKF